MIDETGRTHRDRSARSNHHGTAVEYQLVLPTDRSHVHDGRRRLIRAGLTQRKSLVMFALFEWRRIDHQQHVSSGRRGKLRRAVRFPEVLADRDRHHHAVNLNHARFDSGFEESAFIEDSVVREAVFGVRALHHSAPQHCRNVLRPTIS